MGGTNSGNQGLHEEHTLKSMYMIVCETVNFMRQCFSCPLDVFFVLLYFFKQLPQTLVLS